MDKGEVEIVHQSSEKMWMDILTKLKQGMGFRIDHVNLMNVLKEYDDDVEHRSTPDKLLTTQEILDNESRSMLGSITAQTGQKAGLNCRSVLGNKDQVSQSIEPKVLRFPEGYRNGKLVTHWQKRRALCGINKTAE